jgi:hypothetical protein
MADVACREDAGQARLERVRDTILRPLGPTGTSSDDRASREDVTALIAREHLLQPGRMGPSPVISAVRMPAITSATFSPPLHASASLASAAVGERSVRT